MKPLSNEILFGKKILIFLICISILHIILFVFNTPFKFNNDKDKGKMSRCMDGIYFSTTTISSVGYGDILPLNGLAKMLMSIEHIILIYLSFDEIKNYVHA